MIEQASLIVGDGNWAVKSDSLLGYKIIDGKYYPREMTFTRATTGTRVNAAGLVELVPYNLLQQSQTFDNAAWTKSSGVTITANDTSAPNGTLTADKLIPPIGTSTSYFISQSAFGNCMSIFAKAAEKSKLLIYSGVANSNAYFDLASGQVLTTLSNVSSAAIEDYGNGWYRCSVIWNTTSTLVRIYAADNDNSTTVTGNGIDGIYIWGAQLVEGTQPLTYLPTTDQLDIARIDYSTGSPALLLEPQRTNLASYSQEFNVSSYWSVVSSGDTWQGTGSAPIITPNYGVAPDGTQTADRVQLNLNGGTTINDRSGFSNLAFAVTSGVTYVGSYYIKILDGNSITSIINTNIGVLAAGTNPSVNSYQDVGNGWYRVFKSVLTTTTIGNFRFQIVGPSGVNSVDCLIWGAQLEAGSYATSYIPTAATSVTRNADIISKSDLGTYMSPQNNTIFFDFTTIPGGQNTSFLSFNVSTGNSIQFWYFVAANSINIQLGGVFYNTGILSGKVAIQVNPTNTKMFVNGVLSATAGTTGIVTTLTSSLGSYTNGATMNCKTMQVYNTSLTDAECIALTTL